MRLRRVAEGSMTFLVGLGVALAASVAPVLSQELPPGSFEVTRVVDVSCTNDRVTVDVTYRGETSEVGVGLIGNGVNEAAQEGVQPGATVSLTGEGLGFGETRTYRVVASFLDDQAIPTTVREFTVTRPTSADCSLARSGAFVGVAIVLAGAALLTGVILVGITRRLRNLT